MKNSRVFSKKYVFNPPCLFFFWNSPIGLVWLAANLLIFIELTVSQYLRNWVFPVRCSFQLILHALMSTQTTCIKVDDATKMITGISWYPGNCKGKHWNLVILTNLFEMLYPHLPWSWIASVGAGIL